MTESTTVTEANEPGSERHEEMRIVGMTSVNFLELEITNRCGLGCRHCYADSGITGSHGMMTGDDWCEVIDQAVDLGVEMIQFIGGECTSRPDFPRLLQHAIDAGRKIEVFSNLTRVKDPWWNLFACPNVSLATSYYADTAEGHEAITRRRGSHAHTRANIAEAVRRNIPIRVGIIDILDGQRVEQARADLQALGVTRIRTDRIRGVGRGARGLVTPSVSELCGQCGRGKAAISPDGDVWPCVIGRFLTAGNVKAQPLAQILIGPAWADILTQIPAPAAACNPECNPSQDGNDCAPAETEACDPAYCGPDGA